MKNKNDKVYKINGDIISVMSLSDEIGWIKVRKMSIFRILYISSVLYSFKYKNRINPFNEDYEFNVSLRGPFSDTVEKSLVYLTTNEFLLIDTEGDYVLNNEDIEGVGDLPNYTEKRNWIEVIIYILAIYGEEKIYDFVFRDPQYQDTLQRNSIEPINLDKDNYTHQSLDSLQKVFESNLGEEAKKIDSKRYLDMYFDFVFSKILRGEN